MFNTNISKKWMNLIFYLLMVLVLLTIVYLFYFGGYPKATLERFTDGEPIDNIGYMDYKDHKNILLNGSFDGGKDISGYVDQSGVNEIMSMTNASVSKYVLHQKDTQSITYYQFAQPVQPNSKYVFTTWVCVLSPRNGEMTQFPFQNLVRFRIPMKNGTNDLPTPRVDILQKTTLKNTGSQTSYDWYLVKYMIRTKADVKRDINIYLNYASELPALDIYFAGLGLYKVLDDVESFIFTNGLLAFLSGFYCDSGALSWRDLSANSMNFLLESRASVDTQLGSVDLRDNKISISKGKEIYGKGDKTMTHILLEIDTGRLANTENQVIFQITQKDVSLPNLSLILEVNKNLSLICKDQKVTTTQPPILLNKTLLTIMLDQNSHTCQLYQDGVLLLSIPSCPNLFFESSTISIHSNMNIPMKLYDLLVYNYIMVTDEVKELRNYLMDTSNRRPNAPNTQNYLFADINSNQPTMVEGFTNEGGGGVGGGGDIEGFNFVLNDEFQYVFGNTENVFTNLKKDLCAKQAVTVNDCPSVYIREGKFYVYIPQYSFYHKQFNYYGERCYGEDRDRAKYLFKLNFPDCDVPKVLTPGEGKVNNTCPFIVAKNNPCSADNCAGVDWTKAYVEDLDLSEECKKNVSFYCRTNYELDDQCVAWKPENKYDEESINVRKYFEDPNEYCDVAMFSIEDHPDYEDYIRKDKIPCWGCDLSDQMKSRPKKHHMRPTLPVPTPAPTPTPVPPKKTS
jgi:hypothetical protein